MLVQVSAGFAGAVILIGGIGLLLGMVAVPEPVMANDEPLGAMTAPHYLYSTASPADVISDHDSLIVVEAFINDQGRVYDYNIISGPEDQSTPEPARRPASDERLPARQRLRRSHPWPGGRHLFQHFRPRLTFAEQQRLPRLPLLP